MSSRKATLAAILLCFGIPSPNGWSDEPAVANAKARLEAARKTYHAILDRRQIDVSAVWDGEKLYRWSRRWLEAEQQLSDKPQGRIAAAEAHLKRMKQLETIVKNLRSSGQIGGEELSAQEFYCLEAEQAVTQAKAR